MRPECLPDASAAIDQAPSTLPNSRLADYRTAVDDVAQEATGRLGGCDLRTAERLVTERLGQQDFTSVLSRLEGGVDGVAARVASEIRNYRPSTRSSASDLPAFIRILLLSQIDSVWWSGTPPFVSDADILGSNELVDLLPLRSAKMLQFQYRAQSAGLPGRARDWAQRRTLPDIRPRTAGLRFTRSRPAVVAVVNQSLGYAAVLPSSHCTGHACDVEMQWFRRFDQENLLARLLLERQEAGQLNVIDEGQAWHLCINPLAHDELEAAYSAQLAGS
jgi:hypothetical protein